MTFSNPKPKDYVPHSSPFTGCLLWGQLLRQALLLTLPALPSPAGSPRAPGSTWDCLSEVRDLGHFVGRWVCPLQGAGQPLAILPRQLRCSRS